ncbi:MAG: hotdog fold thioesterase [Propionibacteriales bacterium]|nr:hotdog fold thioesterase [Propionibacteriales bacterium]
MSDLGRRVLAAQPFSDLLGAELTVFEPGRAELRLPLRPQLRQQFGVAHGGVLSYLADNTLTFAGGSVLGPSVLTSEYKISYLEPAVGDVLIARGSVLHVGRRQAVCRCHIFDVKDERETLCATAMGTIRAVSEPATANTSDGDTPAGDTPE